MGSVTQHGYLIIADISGYTSFVAKTELEHSHEILSELLGLLVDKIKPLMTLSKLEGDAVFSYAGEEKITRGETLPEFLERIYVAFRDRQISMKRATTCICQVCRNIPTLDLKFIAHGGSEGRKMYTETNRFEALPNGRTRMHVLVLLNLPLPRFARKVLVKRTLLGRYRYYHMLMDTAKQAGEQYLAAADRE
jgi:hypothetical protein